MIQWLEKMQVVYSSKAQEAGVYVCVCVGRVRLCVCVCVCVCVAGYSGWRRCRLSSQPRHRRLASMCVYVLDVSVCVCCVCVWLDTVAGEDAGCLVSQGSGGWRLRVCMCWTCPSVCVCVCGWTQWLEKMQVVYSSKAQEAGVYVLEACGFDSIPAEMALLHATKQFDGRCHCLTHT